MNTECKDCKFREGDCGHHFLFNGVVNYDIASLSACDQCGNCWFFKPKEKPKGDLISREALKKAIDNAYKEYDGYDPQDLMRFAERVDTEIDNAPTVTDQSRELVQKSIELGRRCGYFEGKTENKRPQGEWIKLRYYDFKCSLCENSMMDKWNYCPNCGADMRKQSEGDDNGKA